jgi:hypothetical protein
VAEDTRCERTELLVDQCGHCRGLDGPKSDDDRLPVSHIIGAKFAGRCIACDTTFPIDTQIGYVPAEDGWVRMACCGLENIRRGTT